MDIPYLYLHKQDRVYPSRKEYFVFLLRVGWSDCPWFEFELNYFWVLRTGYSWLIWVFKTRLSRSGMSCSIQFQRPNIYWSLHCKLSRLWQVTSYTLPTNWNTLHSQAPSMKFLSLKNLSCLGVSSSWPRVIGSEILGWRQNRKSEGLRVWLNGW